jgi:hypothetical protein
MTWEQQWANPYFIKLRTTEITLNIVGLIPYCKFLKDTHLNIGLTNHMWLSPPLYKNRRRWWDYICALFHTVQLCGLAHCCSQVCNSIYFDVVLCCVWQLSDIGCHEIWGSQDGEDVDVYWVVTCGLVGGLQSFGGNAAAIFRAKYGGGRLNGIVTQKSNFYPCSQEPATGPYPQADGIGTHPSTTLP